MTKNIKTEFIRIPPDSPDVPDAVDQAIEKMADYVGIARNGERVLLAALGLGAAESRLVTEAIVELVRDGSLWLISAKGAGPFLIAEGEAPSWHIRSTPQRPSKPVMVVRPERNSQRRMLIRKDQ